MYIRLLNQKMRFGIKDYKEVEIILYYKSYYNFRYNKNIFIVLMFLDGLLKVNI